jgi:gamma-glutamylcyclotransferase (GGCT)/AIG2-like uncharacterized protein YtfP
MPTEEGKSRFSLFTYGSLRTDGEHHDIVAPYLIGTQKATLPGALHRRQDGYWTVRDIPACWTGTTDRHADIVRLASTTGVGRDDHEFELYDEPVIEGEVLHLNGGSILLARLDEFEGFRGEPGTVENEYLRVAVRVNMGAHQQPCFCYADAKYEGGGPTAPEGKVGRFLEL